MRSRAHLKARPQPNVDNLVVIEILSDKQHFLSYKPTDIDNS